MVGRLTVHSITVAKKSFYERANDLKNREWRFRLIRFLRMKAWQLGDAMQMVGEDPRVVRAWRKGWDPVHFLRFLRWREQGFRPQVIYDIGAHEGTWSEMCGAVFGPSQCLLFEPQAECQKRIQARQVELGADWRLLPVALGQEEGAGLMHLTQNLAASSLLAPLREAKLAGEATKELATEPVVVKALDALARAEGLPKPDLVKIDVQGFEDRILAGGRETISSARRVVVETTLRPIYDQQPLLPEILGLLCEWGFRLEDMTETLRSWPEGRLWQVDLWLERGEREA